MNSMYCAEHRAILPLRGLCFCLVFLLVGCGGASSDVSPPTSPPVTVPPPEPVPQPEPEPEPYIPSADLEPDPALPASSSSDYVTASQASRFLGQASFGATAKDIVKVTELGFAGWIDEQIALEQTLHLPLFDTRIENLGFEAAPIEENDEDGWYRDLIRSDIWWEVALWGRDQLRQRVAYSLSQITVISNVSSELYNDTRGITDFHDMLAAHAFGNYRDLLKAVTLHPMMGEYLSMVRNEKANEERHIRPDENYARELMQLFSIGLVELNLDGSIRTDDNGDPIATYGQDDVKALARVFTGWNHAGIDNWWQWVNSGEAEVNPMQAFENYHDTDSKTLFGDNSIAAGQTAEQDLDTALDILFAHDNIAPFISKQLIQRLVTSNPTPAYVERVATVFNDNGQNVKGDMAAVVKAILLDDEAQTGHILYPDTFGKLREPILKFAALWRATKAQGAFTHGTEMGNDIPRIRFRSSERATGQRPFGSFSVFNFYRPDYQPTGAIKDQQLIAPEFQILNESTIITTTNALAYSIYWKDISRREEQGPFWYDWDVYYPYINLTEEKAIAHDEQALLDRLNLLLMAGQMSASMQTTLLEFLQELPTDNDYLREIKVYDALFMIMASPEFAVRR
ncbi:DUF1800 domain-containing protein [Alteromonadaceae bacterium BrNp21-10]|nr:DUF1800 domain-containing protein [Alteromonadaceae bacterium BrNp21-10]